MCMLSGTGADRDNIFRQNVSDWKMCLEALRIDFYCLSKPLQFLLRTQTTQMVYSTPVLLFYMKAFKKFLVFQLKREVRWNQIWDFTVFQETPLPLSYLRRGLFSRQFFISSWKWFESCCGGDIQGMDRREHFPSHTPVVESQLKDLLTEKAAWTW